MNKDIFKKEVLESDKPVLVDFFAAWCGPCKMMMPILENFEKTHADIKVVKVNVDESEDLAREYGVMSIPTLVAFKDGKEYRRSLGVQNETKLEELFK